ncbi:MAG: rhodanese-like domain-containing protein [Verrucomicrobiota bacterium]
MKTTQHVTQTNRRQLFHAACFIAACLSVTSCFEPRDRPIPPLDPSLSTVKTPAPVIEAPSTPGTITRMPLGNLYQLTQGNAALIYDVRPTIFYKMGHIPGAISFPKDDFDKAIAKHEVQIKAANKNQTPVVIYCTNLACPDALTVATQLSQRGHNVSVLQGGYESWKAATE